LVKLRADEAYCGRNILSTEVCVWAKWIFNMQFRRFDSGTRLHSPSI
jgi:hypothetical protein